MFLSIHDLLLPEFLFFNKGLTVLFWIEPKLIFKIGGESKHAIDTHIITIVEHLNFYRIPIDWIFIYHIYNVCSW